MADNALFKLARQPQVKQRGTFLPIAETGAAVPLAADTEGSQPMDDALLQYLAAISVHDQPMTPMPQNMMPAPSDIEIRIQDLIDRGIDPLERFRSPRQHENPNAPRPWFDRRG